MKKALKLIKDYQGFQFSTGVTTGDDFKSFARKYKNVISEQIDGVGEIINWHRNHYCLSGFICHRETGKLMYFSIPDVRWNYDDWMTNILVRTAEHEADYSGGRNQYTTLMEFRRAFEQIAG